MEAFKPGSDNVSYTFGIDVNHVSNCSDCMGGDKHRSYGENAEHPFTTIFQAAAFSTVDRDNIVKVACLESIRSSL